MPNPHQSTPKGYSREAGRHTGECKTVNAENQLETVFWPTWDKALLILGVSAISIAYEGISFGTGDQPDLLALIDHTFDPTFLSRDWYVVAVTSGFGVRDGFILILRALCWIFSLQSAFLLLHWATRIVLVFGCWLLSEQETAFTQMLLAVCVVGANLGSSVPHLQALVPQDLAVALVVLGLGLFCVNRRWASMLCLMLATCIHQQIGPEAWAVMFVTAVVLFPKRFRCPQQYITYLVYLGFLCGLIYVFAKGGDFDSTMKFPELFHILAVVRNPWHYNPSTFGISSYVQFAAMLLTMIGCLVFGVQSPRQRCMLTFVAIVAVLCASIGPFLNMIASPLLLKTQFFRLTAFAPVLGWLIVGANCFSGNLGLGMYPLLAAITPSLYPMLAGYVWILGLGRNTRLAQQPYWKPLVAGATLTLNLFVLALLGQSLPRVPPLLFLGIFFVDLFIRYTNLPQTRFAALVFVFLFLGWWRSERESVIRPDPFHAAATWIASHTDVNSLFITPPAERGFRWYASRATVIDFWGYTWFRDRDALEWYRRLEAVAGQSLAEFDGFRFDELDKYYAAQPPKHFTGLCSQYRATYYMVYAGSASDRGDPFYRNERFAVYKCPQQY